MNYYFLIPNYNMPYKYNKNKNGVNRAVQRYVNKQIGKNIETKFGIVNWDTTVQDEGRTPIDQSLVALAVGDTQSSRTGNQLRLTGLYGQFICRQADTTNIVRMILYIPKNKTVTMSAAGGIGVLSAVDLDKFTVLEDKLLHMNNVGGNQKYAKIAKKFNRGSRAGIKVQYDGTTATDVTENDLRLYVVSDSTVINDPAFLGNMRTYFKDA